MQLASRYVQENVARNSQLAYLIAIASGPLWKTQENDWVARLRHEVHTQWLIEDPQRGTSRFGGHGRNDALPSPGLGDTTQLQQYLVDAVLEDGVCIILSIRGRTNINRVTWTTTVQCGQMSLVADEHYATLSRLLEILKTK